MIACYPNLCKRKFTDTEHMRYNINRFKIRKGTEKMGEFTKEPGGGGLKHKTDPGTGWKTIADPGSAGGNPLMRDPGAGGGYRKDPGTGIGSIQKFGPGTGI
ncbi:hypothetical protein CON65_02605 [Bacillus pseudomycoides]|uniref:Uncharacterized protein n=3 Tax=Bacillaceae TaxID=186817 RepID=A0AA91ZVE8_9BACI|nr:hypothetical protein CON65_02605 [Bacillus pseudomycoides]PEU08669.1 hypothetical protein CN525_25645 [Bacillus sp. AFS014408]PEU15869.1 hypothetical protein CN524_06310 [Bacillus sp. AFS019443]PFW64831.1 hypothetical protein COL20_02250 [Bacillus sp. AFS075034]